MKRQSKIELSDKGILNKKLNIQRIKEYKINYEISKDNYIKNKKTKNEMKKINEIKDLRIKDDEPVKWNIPKKENKGKKIKDYSDYLYLKVTRQIIRTMIKIIFNNIKILLINIENLKEQTDLKIDKFKNIQKQKRRINIAESNFAFIIYISIILIILKIIIIYMEK